MTYFRISFSENYKNSIIGILLFIFCIPLHGQNKPVNRGQTVKTSAEVFHLDSLGKHYESSWVDSSTYYFQLAIKAAQKNNDFSFVATTMNRLCFNNIYLIQDETKAIEWVKQAITVAKKNNDALNLAESHKLLAVISINQTVGNAVGLLETAIAYARQVGA
jgi:hypothetical protein